jgi:hypothetical protein
VQDGHPTSCRQTVAGQIADGIDVAKFRPLTGSFGHFLILFDNFIGILIWLADSIAMQQTDIRVS